MFNCHSSYVARFLKVTKKGAYFFLLPLWAKSIIFGIFLVSEVSIAQTGTLSAFPTVVNVPSHLHAGETNLYWTTSSNNGTSDVTVEVNSSSPQWIGCTGFGSSYGKCNVNWITGGNTYVFKLYGNSQVAPKLLATMTVIGRHPVNEAPGCDKTITSGSYLNSTTLAGSGKVFCLLYGANYYINSTLVIPSGSIIKGQGGGGALPRIIDVRASTQTGPMIFVPAGANGVDIRNVSLKGRKVPNASQADPNSVGIYVLGSNALLKNISIETTARPSVAVVNANGARLDSLVMKDVDGLDTGATPCIYVSGASNLVIGNSTCTGGNVPSPTTGGDADGGIALYHTNDFQLTGNQVLYQGFYFVNSTLGLVSDNVTFGAIDWPLDIVAGTNNIILQNNIAFNGRWGGAVVDGANNLIFKKNIFRGNNTWGLSSCSGANLVVRNGVATYSQITFSQNLVSPGPVSCQMHQL